MARKTDFIWVRVAPEHKERLVQMAKEKDVSLSEMARSLMLETLEGGAVTEEWLDRIEKKLEVIREKTAVMDRAVPKRKGRGIRRVRA